MKWPILQLIFVPHQNMYNIFVVDFIMLFVKINGNVKLSIKYVSILNKS